MADSMTYKLFGQDVSLSKAFEKAGKAAGKMGKDGQKSFKGLGMALGGIGLVAAAGAVAKFGKASIDAFENTGKEAITLQRYMGGTIEDASRLGHAFRMNGVDSQTGARALGIFSKFTVQADQGIAKFANQQRAAAAAGKPFHKQLTGAGAAMAELGVKTRDSSGHIRPMKDLLGDTAEKFAHMAPGANKTALVLKTFGRNGMALMPFLNRGKKGISDLMAESDKLGTTLTGKDAAAVKESIANKRKLSESVKGLQIAVGKNLLPIVETFVTFLTNKVVPVLKAVVSWMDSHKAIVQILAGVLITFVGGLYTFVKVMNIIRAVTGAWTLAQEGLNLAFLENPLTWVVIAIVALVAAIIIAYKHSQTFRNIVQAAMHGVSVAFHWLLDAGKAVFNWIKKHWPLLLVFLLGPFSIATLLIIKNWKKIHSAIVTAIHAVTTFVKKAWSAVWGWVSNFFKNTWDTIGTNLSNAIGTIVGFVKGIKDKITKVAANIWDGLKGGLSTVVNWIIDRINDVLNVVQGAIDAFNKLPGPDINVHLNPLPHVALASGGIVTRPTMALIGEAGPEAVIPLGRGGGFGQTIVVNVHAGAIGNEQYLARVVSHALTQASRKGLATV